MSHLTAIEIRLRMKEADYRAGLLLDKWKKIAEVYQMRMIDRVLLVIHRREVVRILKLRLEQIATGGSPDENKPSTK